ncbi:MAG: AAA family ATPase [Firmicutes bacterium]|nr:AAA family ATPase [Bacillota bacterium]
MDPLAPEGRPGRRIVVVGTTGSGKTTFARRLAAMLGCPHVELDALHWEPQWTPAPVEVFRHRVREVTRAPCWVVDGNYSQVREVLWPAADTIVWLDYPLPVILGRLLRRTARRVLLREELWNGNREGFLRSFLSRDSILLWALRSYRRRRREYPALLARPEYRHLRVIRLRTPREAEAWLRGVAAAVQASPHLPAP